MENLIKITVEDDMKGSRIDAALAGIVQNLSRSALQKLIEQGGVSVNGQICTEKIRMHSEPHFSQNAGTGFVDMWTYFTFSVRSVSILSTLTRESSILRSCVIKSSCNIVVPFYIFRQKYDRKVDIKRQYRR